MSKLYKNYVILKIQNPDKIYLFESGIFYIFIHDDAILMSNLLNLKLSNLNSVIYKCGFPINSAEKYFKILKEMNYDFSIIPANSITPQPLATHLISKQYEDIIEDFLKINADELSIPQAFDSIKNFQKRFKKAQNYKL